MPTPDRFHVNPTTGLPNACDGGDSCEFGGDAFHYETKRDAQVAWKARQLERGIIAYRNVMQAKEKQEEDAALDRLMGKAKAQSKKFSLGFVKSMVTKNLSKYMVNFLGVFMAYAVASGKWLTEDWVRRLLPAVASIVLVALLCWFTAKAWKGSRQAASAAKRRRIKKAARKVPTSRPRP